jgi:hypothetical protein
LKVYLGRFYAGVRNFELTSFSEVPNVFGSLHSQLRLLDHRYYWMGEEDVVAILSLNVVVSWVPSTSVVRSWVDIF